jgi:hypothetical protein
MEMIVRTGAHEACDISRVETLMACLQGFL